MPKKTVRSFRNEKMISVFFFTLATSSAHYQLLVT